MNYKLIFIFILSILLAFGLGVGWGARQIATEFMDIAVEVLDIQLTPQAKDMLINRPELMSYAIKNYYNVTNPFKKANERLQYEKCMIEGGSPTGCYNGLLAKYGNYTQ